jgi:GAF domain-containing protein
MAGCSFAGRLVCCLGGMPGRHSGGESRSAGNHEILLTQGAGTGLRDMGEEPADFGASITELQAVLLGTESIDGFLRDLAVLAARSLGEGLSCGITLQPNGKPLTVASSDANASQVDELQYGLDRGPCLTALRTGKQVRIDDLVSDRRWREYAVRALAHGVRSSLSMPLIIPDRRIGAINLYSDRPHFFGEAATRLAERFTRDANIAVGIAGRLAGQAVLTEQLRASLASRAVIDQAIGVIMAQQRCTADDAFAVLRSVSQDRSVKVRQIAEQIVTAITGRPTQPSPFDLPR